VVAWTRRSAPALAVPSIAIAEMAYGIEKLTAGRRRDALLDALRRVVLELSERLFGFNVAAAWAYGRILAAARRAGQPMALPDAAIAAIALANGCALATRNIKDFTTTGLELVDPWRTEA
jgi:predicted nucleic acid-binding protein